MQKILFLLLFVVAAYAFWQVLQPTSAPRPLEEGYRFLYDGKSLDNWRVIGGKGTFEADGESIVGRYGPGESTFLRTEGTFGDFSLKLQMRWDEAGNSGVLFRAQQRAGDGPAYGYEYELDPTERSWSGGIYDEGRRGWLENLADKPAVRNAIRRDDWNEVEIEARGTRLQTWINGVAAADIVDGLDAKGFIALQVHAGQSGVMRWRNIRIKELAPLRFEGESLLSAAEWRGDDLERWQFSTDNILIDHTDGFVSSRRQFSDAMVQLTLPACENPTVIQLRSRPDAAGRGEQFAEVKIYADRAEARLVTVSGQQQKASVALEKSAEHRLTAVTVGSSLTLTVDTVDALRLHNAALPERGRIRIQPARCAEVGRIADFKWYRLKQQTSEPLFYQTLDNVPSPVLSPQQALSAFSLAPEFAIELVASEPLVAEPVAMAWDEYGRLYVVELRGYMRDAYGSGSDAPVGQVVRLDDLDGDGRMDTSEVFLGGLVGARAVAVVNDGILVGEPPHLWLCELPTRESLCENKRRVGGYAVDAESNVEHMENGLRLGLDNWLYSAKSNRSLRLQNGKLRQRDAPARGQWGIAQDDVGRLFYNHNSTWVQADYFAGEDLVQPGRPGVHTGLGVNLTAPAEVFSVRVNPGVNRAYLNNILREDGRLHLVTGVSGLTVYRGDQFPEEYRGDVFVSESAGNVVARFTLKEEGMALTASQQLYPDARWGQRDFLGSSDERFRPVDVMNGPDGALYIIDMYRGIIQDDHFMTDELREQVFQRGLEGPLGLGRIWRVRHTAGKSDRISPDFAADEQLHTALQHPNGWVRDTAQRLLLVREGDHAAALVAIAAGDDSRAALHAIWALQARGELELGLVMDLVVSGDLHRQVQALRAGAELLSESDLLALHSKLSNPAEALATQLAFSMRYHTDKPRVRAALAALITAQLASPYVRQAAVRAVSGRELLFLREYLASGQLDDTSASGKALLTLLADNTYRSLRGDLRDHGRANPALLELLALVANRPAWQQAALLRGIERVAKSSDFVPAQLDAPPPIFMDSSAGEDSPLWTARLGARLAFTWPGDELARGITPLGPSQLAAMAVGQQVYPTCAVCHGDSGAGIDGLAPALAGAQWVTGPPEWLARIILQGMTGPVVVAGETFDGVMPPHGHRKELDDATLAGLMTYLRRSWGNRADPVSPARVRDIRAASANRKQPWTVASLRAVPFDRGYERFEGEYAISFVTLSFAVKADRLHVSVPMYGGALMEELGPNRFRAAAGGESAEIEFLVESDGAVNALILTRNGQQTRANRKR
ncbi:MAG: DUF1080 domain-containing protein [Halioglobus sp.]|nr:DUF1080 domain-containing protein [Halioglobus sp.]